MDVLFTSELSLLTSPNSVFHVVLFGEDNGQQTAPDIGALTLFGLDFVKHGVKAVSILQSGYAGFHKLAVAGAKGFELMNHDPETCHLCLGTSQSFFSETLRLTARLGQKSVQKTQSIGHSFMDFLYGTSQEKPTPPPRTKPLPVPAEKTPATDAAPTAPQAQEPPPPQPEPQPAPGQEEQPQTDEEEEDDDDYLKEIVQENVKFESFLNIGTDKSPIWKPVLTVITSVSILIVERVNSSLVLLEDIGHDSIEKIKMKKTEPEKFTIIHKAGELSIRIPENFRTFIQEITKYQN